MRNIFPALACSVGLLVCGAALADGTQQSTQPNATPATFSTGPESDGTNRVVCRHVLHEGMMLSRVVCGTQHQWDLARYIAQQNVRSMQSGR